MRGVRKDPERTEVRALMRRVPLAGARVLEIGCGDGRLTRRLGGIVRSVVAIDPEAEEIARANRMIPARLRGKVRFEVGSGETLRFPDRSFPIAVLSWSL